MLLTGAGGTLVRIAGGGGAAVRRGAGGGADLIGATAIPTMSSSSKFRVAARSRIAAGGEVLMSAGPEAGAAGVDAAGATEERGRGMEGRTLALLMLEEPANVVPLSRERAPEKIRHDLATIRPEGSV